MRSINVLFRDKTAHRIKEDEAAVLVSAEKATYLSNTMYKAIQAGISLDSIMDRRDDKAIKLQIQAIIRKQPPRKVEPVLQEDEPQEPRLSKRERRQRRAVAETEN